MFSLQYLESATTNKEDQRSRSSSSKNSSSSNIGDVEDTTKRSEQFDTHGWDSQNRNIASSTVSSAVNSPLHTLPNTLQNTVLDQLNQAPHHSSIPALPVLPAIPLLNDIQNESLTTIGAVSDSGISEPQVSTLADPLFDFDYGDEDDLLSSVIPLGSTSQRYICLMAKILYLSLCIVQIFACLVEIDIYIIFSFIMFDYYFITVLAKRL